MKQLLQKLAMDLVDLGMAVWPRALPDEAALRNCKIISHRGEHDNRTVMENTLSAFDNARAAGVWGIECDIRWSRDQQPVICHDRNTSRVFGLPLRVAEHSLEELRSQVPALPTLAEVVQKFAGNTHLMLEIKECNLQDLKQQQETLTRILEGMTPGRDYHFLALDPDLFQLVDHVPAEALLPVAETNTAEMSALALQHGYCGLAGHYLLLGASLQRRHQSAGQRIATGFPRSRNCLYRELGRGVEWIFSNDAVYLQGLLDEMRDAGRF